MTDVLIINTISHIAMCAFLYSQYREQCEKRWIIELTIFLFLIMCSTEAMSFGGINKVFVVLIQTFITVFVGFLALKKYSILILLNTFNAMTFVLPGNIIGNLMLIYIPDVVSPFFKALFAAMV